MGVANPTFSIGEAAEVLDLPPRTVNFYLSGPIRKTGVAREAVGSGNPRRLSVATVMRLGIVAELCGIGCSPAASARHAAAFCDRGSPGRAAGELYSTHQTYLVASNRICAAVAHVSPETSFQEILESTGATARHSIVLNVSDIVANLNIKLSSLN